MNDLRAWVPQIAVSAAQMRSIEAGIFAAGMPVAALMEKAALLASERIQQLYPPNRSAQVGILVGTGHNGGDALVIARELYLQNYRVRLFQPFPHAKDLTTAHARYAYSLGIEFVDQLAALEDSQLLIDGFFGFGLNRPLTGEIADIIAQIHRWSMPIVSIDLPSGLHTDTGEVLGIAIRATHTLCLGLWKLALFQDHALEYTGKVEKIDFGILDRHLATLDQDLPKVQIIDRQIALNYLPLSRPLVTHKYRQGNLLLICGSRRYAGSALLAGLGARATGVGMLSIAVPASLKDILVARLPEALIIGCPETPTGAIAELPVDVLAIDQFDAIACGPGLTKEAKAVVEAILTVNSPLILDADALNILAELGTIPTLNQRRATTVLTPHLGEFKRLFPTIDHPDSDRITAVRTAAQQSGSIVLFKGARTAISDRSGNVWLIPHSTPALARGGSGDVLTGLIGGLLTQPKNPQAILATVATAAWWHAAAALTAAAKHTEMGVDSETLARYLLPIP
jgi:ADP-dependent NAD(P)H-hydrate dehydratase / NAD(P)H-hydrate epimerase